MKKIKDFKTFEAYTSEEEKNINDILDKANKNGGISKLDEYDLEILKNNGKIDNELYNLINDYIEDLKNNIYSEGNKKMELFLKSKKIKDKIKKEFNIINPHDLPDKVEELYYLIVDTVHNFMMGTL